MKNDDNIYDDITKYKDTCSVNKHNIPLKIITVCTDENNEQLK